ncbi:MAG TPA: DUF4158 domain-containing protein [Roseiflexaceae bacterium]|nr:DUF4158 domain-containing protein [Roseiflexaceae bacterium]
MQQWTIDDLIDHWTLLPSERDQLANKTGATRLGFAVMLKAFGLDGRFPSSIHDIAPAAVAYVAKQVDVAPELYQHYDWRGRISARSIPFPQLLSGPLPAHGAYAPGSLRLSLK